MNTGRIFAIGLFIAFLFFTAADIQDLAVDGSLTFIDWDLGEHSYLWLMFDFAILISAYHDAWGKERKKNG